MALNSFDVVIVVVLGFCLVRGLFRGLIREVSSIIGVFGGFYGAYTYYPLAEALLVEGIGETAYSGILSFLALFCLIFAAVSLLGVAIKYLLNIAFLGWLDRLCGVLFGFTKGLLIVSVLLIALTTFLPRNSPLIRESKLSGYVTALSEMMVTMVPKEMEKTFFTRIEGMKESWNRQK